MSDHDLDALEAVAKAATPGPWEAYADRCVRTEPYGPIIYDDSCQENENADANMAYVATFDPPTTLALIAEVRSLRARVAEVEASFALDGEDGHPCIRVEAYLRAEDARKAAEQQVADLTAERDEARNLARMGAAGQAIGETYRVERDALLLKSAAQAEVIERVRALPLVIHFGRDYVSADDLDAALAATPTPPAEVEEADQ